jgi:NDP-hexose 4-ketoreductase
VHLAVVGGRGWLGRAIVAEARRRHMTVTVVARTPGPGAVAVDPGDTSSLATALGRSDVVVNAAGSYRLDDAKAATAANYEVPDQLGWLAARSPWRLVHLGSAAEYGPGSAGPEAITEDHPCRPRSIYGTTKLAGALAVMRWREQGARAVVARVFNVVDTDLPPENPFHGIAAQVLQVQRGQVGPMSPPASSSASPSSSASSSAGSAAAPAPPPCLPIGEVGIGDPATTRDVSRRATVAAAVVALAETTAELPPVVNVCSGRPTGFGDLAMAMARELEVRVTVRDLGWPRGGRIVGDPARLRSLIGFPYVDRLPDLARSILGLPDPAAAAPSAATPPPPPRPAGDH